jgi:multiple sugar transport system permease protein
MPHELEDAAHIDGCGPVRSFRTVMIPNAGPALLVSFLFSLVWYWNDYFYSGMFLRGVRTLALEIGNPRGELLMYRDAFLEYVVYTQSAALLFVVPLLVIYVFLQRYFTESIERTGMVG